MCQYSGSSDGSSDSLAVPDGAIIEKTDAGRLVFMPSGDGKLDLLGFVDIHDTSAMIDELRKRRIDYWAVFDRVRYPEFEKEEEECWCMTSDFPCWDCYHDGLRDLPD